MSLATYSRQRQRYIDGNDAALDRMLRAVTPAVAARLGQIEHDAAVTRREQAAARAEQALQERRAHREETWAEAWSATKLAFAMLAVCVAAGLLLTCIGYAITGGPHWYRPAASAQQQYEQNQALPDFAPSGPGWVTIDSAQGQPVSVIHVRSSRETDFGDGPELMFLTWSGQEMAIIPGTTWFFTTYKPEGVTP